MDDAVLRECAAARTGVAVMDATTLGKIDVQGPDAGAFLDRIYTNTFSTLKVGSCRYGVMCRLDGMVFDDGVTSRLADDRFLMTTTTGNAAPVMDHLEEYLQTEWPDLRVRATSVTEQWATVAVVGPRAGEVVARARARPRRAHRRVPVHDLAGRGHRRDAGADLPDLVLGRAGLRGQRAVVARARPVGGGHGRPDAPFGITPYGTETLHVLRAEKGYPIIGQETDGTVTPHDLGLGTWCPRREGLHRTALAGPADTSRPGPQAARRPPAARPGRAAAGGRPAGAADADLARLPVPMVGYVTSSYRSAALGRTFALGLVEGGRDRIGERLLAPLLDGSVVEAEIAPSVLFDPENRRRDGEPGEPGEPDHPDAGAERAVDR